MKGEKKKIYDLDFWLYPKEGTLEVTKTMIHKHPVLEGKKWITKPRYTFQGDERVPVND